MKEYLEMISEYVEASRVEMIRFWEKLVNLEGRSDEIGCLDLVVHTIKEAFEEEGFQCELYGMGQESGPVLTGILGEGWTGKPILFSGHYDTVFQKGSAGEQPFHILDGKAYGPGVLDMKGGIVIALYVIKALNHIHFDRRPIKILFAGDEEAGHLFSDAEGVLQEYAAGCLFGFNMETGLIDGGVCIGRKGNLEYTVETQGISSHPGNAFTIGRNAVEEMAYKIIDFQRVTDLERGITVSVGTVQGGTVSNIIPDSCTAKVDIRFETAEDYTFINQKIKEICEQTHVEGTSTQVSGSKPMYPFETTPGVLKLYDFVKQSAAALHIKEPTGVRLGGASDAASIVMAGTPVLCSCGVCGEGNHTRNEYALVESLFERTKLLSALVFNHETFEEDEKGEVSSEN